MIGVDGAQVLAVDQATGDFEKPRTLAQPRRYMTTVKRSDRAMVATQTCRTEPAAQARYRLKPGYGGASRLRQNPRLNGQS
jgi:hypothetical protein